MLQRRPIGLTMKFALILLFLSAGIAFSATDFASIEKRIAELQPTASEKRFDEIGWAQDIRDAKRLAKERNRPVFMFTHDGRMNLGRC
jgi:hypothetical protein